MVLVGSAGRLAAVDLREEMTSYLIYTTVFSSYFCTDKSLCFCAVAEQASRDWDVRLVTWEWELGLGAGASADVQVFGSVQSTVPSMQEVLEPSTQSFTLSFSITMSSQVFSLGF